jgi:hypothetical protein
MDIQRKKDESAHQHYRRLLKIRQAVEGPLRAAKSAAVAENELKRLEDLKAAVLKKLKASEAVPVEGE